MSPGFHEWWSQGGEGNRATLHTGKRGVGRVIELPFIQGRE